MWQTVSVAATGDWECSVADSAQCSNSRLQHIADIIIIIIIIINAQIKVTLSQQTVAGALYKTKV